MLTLSQQQKSALDAIKSFAGNKNKSVFILKGYAGTGKTTIIRTMLPELEDMGKIVKLMAPTGRAAKNLSEKFGLPAYSIHNTINELKEFHETHHDETGNWINEGISPTQRANGVDDLQLFFQIRPLDTNESPENLVCIIDEASMISSCKATNEGVHFGTDILLADLLTFGNIRKGAKFIFIGDPAQLPPVGDCRSAALDEKYFDENGIGYDCCELTEVFRQTSRSTILKNAMKVRNLLLQTERSELVFERAKGEVDDITAQEIVEDYVSTYPRPLLGSSIIICHSNALANSYNNTIRSLYFADTSHPQPGDIVQVVRNNYDTGLYNGDLAQLTSISDSVETQTAPVWIASATGRERINVQLHFRNVSLLSFDGKNINCKIIESLLYSSHTGLTAQESSALFINFRMRHPEMKTLSDIQKGLMDDPYFNALCVKFGYAITCHKAQGGEWEKVYIDYRGRTGLDNDSLRWVYTATTRAAKQLLGVAMPNIQILNHLHINAITKTAKVAKDALCVAKMGDVAMLPANATNSQKAKFKSIESELISIGCKINKVECYQYQDRYFIQTPNGEQVYNLIYNGSGIYTSTHPISTYANNSLILEALGSVSYYRFDVHFHSEFHSLEQLYQTMTSFCDELDIPITNITEAKYQVVFHLKTSGLYSAIQFYYNAKNAITYAAPLSDKENDDIKLKELINKLSNNL